MPCTIIMCAKKAKTILAILEDFLTKNTLSSLCLLDVGSSTGIIDNFVADHFAEVTGIDPIKPGAYIPSRFVAPHSLPQHSFMFLCRINISFPY